MLKYSELRIGTISYNRSLTSKFYPLPIHGIIYCATNADIVAYTVSLSNRDKSYR